MVRPQGDDQTPVNLAGIQYFPVDSINVVEFHEEADGKGFPNAVMLILHVGGEWKHMPPFIMRMNSRQVCDELIVALIAHSKSVWPDEPIDCDGFDPDAICKCGRRIEDHARNVVEDANP